MRIFAHRGYSAKFPENSLLAFKKAFEVGADGIELDVRHTKEGKLIVFHDADLKRMFGIDKKESDMDFEEVRKLRFSGQQIPTLDEVLDVVPKNGWVIVEVKEHVDGEKSVRCVLDHGLKDRAIISSFDHNLIADLKKSHPGMNFAMLLGEEHKDLDISEIWNRIVSIRPHSVHIPKDAFDMFGEAAWKFVEEIKKAGIEVFLWNTNDLDFVSKHADLIDAVIVDEVERFVEWKEGMK